MGKDYLIMIYNKLVDSEWYFSSVFENSLEYIYYLLMKYIHESDTPVGAWSLREKLLRHGIECGTATIGRYLKTLDGREYTVGCGNQGRRLTPKGTIYLRKIEKALEQAELQTTLSTATQINEYKDLIELLYVRKVLETETAAAAAKYATEEELNRLQDALEAHERCVAQNQDPTETALNFHQTVADISHNKYLQALIKLLIFQESEIEYAIESLVSRELGHKYIVEHRDIVAAILKHEPKRAAELMSEHVRTIYSDVYESIRDDKNLKMR